MNEQLRNDLMGMKLNSPIDEQTVVLAAQEIKRLERALNWSLDDPRMDDFIEAVKSEMQHQRKRWGKEHDHGKGAFDWIALAVRLQGKMVEAIWDKDKDKFLHHVITLAAVMGNCHAAQISKRD